MIPEVCESAQDIVGNELVAGMPVVYFVDKHGLRFGLIREVLPNGNLRVLAYINGWWNKPVIRVVTLSARNNRFRLDSLPRHIEERLGPEW